MAALSHARKSSVVLKISLLLSLVLTIVKRIDERKSHRANLKEVRNNPFISVYLCTREHLEIGVCLNGLASTRRKAQCHGRSYTLTPHSTDQRSHFNPVMPQMCCDMQSNPGPITHPCNSK